MIVMKFGGTSVGNGDAFAQVVQVVSRAREEQKEAANPGVVVVTSAMSGVTNTLVEAAEKAAMGDEHYHVEAQDGLLLKHQYVAGRFIESGSERATLSHLFDERLRQLNRLCSSIAVLGELTDRGLDVVSGLG